MQENVTILKQLAGLERPTFPVNPSTIPIPRGILDRDSGLPLDPGTLWVIQEMFLKAYLLEQDHPQPSSKIHGIWHHLLADGDLVLHEILWNMKEE